MTQKALRNITILILLDLLCIFISCEKKTGQTQYVIEYRVTKDYTSEALRKADSVLATMTLEERVGQCLMPSIKSRSDEETIGKLLKYLNDYHIGGILLLAGDKESVRSISEIGKSTRLAPFISIDAEWGLGMRLKDGSMYPRNGYWSEESTESELYDYGHAIAEECRELGINVVLGPVMDISSSKTGTIGSRSFGGEPGRVSDLGIAYAKGLESGGVISVAKHFPGHGGVSSNSHIRAVYLERDISELDTLDLKPFNDYIKSGLTGIMAGHIKAPGLDPSGRPASVSPDILNSLLREELKFKGLIFTDAFDMGGAEGYNAGEALHAGADVVLCPKDISEEYQLLLNKIQDGTFDERVLNDRVRRILLFKYLKGIM